MGHELADGFAHEHLHDISSKGLAVAVCYEAVPTAAYFLRKHFTIRLNEHLIANDLPPCQEAHIKRVATFFQDFGKMSAAERMQNLDKDDFHLITDIHPNKTLMYLDDIRVTVAHERKMLSVLKRQRVLNAIWVTYFAELIDADVDPTLENTLNYCAFPVLRDIAQVPGCGHFCPDGPFCQTSPQPDAGRLFGFFVFTDELVLRAAVFGCFGGSVGFDAQVFGEFGNTCSSCC